MEDDFNRAMQQPSSDSAQAISRRRFCLLLVSAITVGAVTQRAVEWLWSLVFGPRWRQMDLSRQTEWGGRQTIVENRNFYSVPVGLEHCGMVMRFWRTDRMNDVTIRIWAEHALYEARENFAEAFAARAVVYYSHERSSLSMKFIILLLEWSTSQGSEAVVPKDDTGAERPNVAFLINPSLLFDRRVPLSSVLEEGIRVYRCHRVIRSGPDGNGLFHSVQRFRVLEHLVRLEPAEVF